MAFRSALLATTFLGLLLTGCRDHQNDLVAPSNDEEIEARQLVVTDRTPVRQATVAKVSDALSRSGGRLIVGVKEEMATRGVSSSGTDRLSRSMALKAETSILRAFPELHLVSGVIQEISMDLPTGGLSASFVNPFLVVETGKRGATARSLIDRILSHPLVAYVEADWLDTVLSGTPLDTDVLLAQAPEQPSWGVDTLRAPLVWPNYDGTRGFYLAVMDSGLDPSHPDVSPLWALPPLAHEFYNYVSDVQPQCSTVAEPCYYEEFPHGTGVFGQAIAPANGVGGIGVAPGHAHRLVFKIGYGTQGIASASAMASALNHMTWRIQNPVAWCNPSPFTCVDMSKIPVGVTSAGWLEGSCGGSGCQSLEDAFNENTSLNETLWFAAAGENGIHAYPAAFDDVVSVGALATGAEGLGLLKGSPVGQEIDFVAPGLNQFLPYNTNLLPSGMKHQHGTSFAAPLAAGVALLVMEQDPNLTASQLLQRMKDYARDVESPDWNPRSGWGIPDAVCIIEQISACPGEGIPLPLIVPDGDGGDCNDNDPTNDEGCPCDGGEGGEGGEGGGCPDDQTMRADPDLVPPDTALVDRRSRSGAW